MEVGARDPRTTDHLTPNAGLCYLPVRPMGMGRYPSDSEPSAGESHVCRVVSGCAANSTRRTATPLDSGRRDPEPAMSTSARTACRARTMPCPIGRKSQAGPNGDHRTANVEQANLRVDHAAPNEGSPTLPPYRGGPERWRACLERRAIESERRWGDSPLATRRSERRVPHLYPASGRLKRSTPHFTGLSARSDCPPPEFRRFARRWHRRLM